MSFTKKQLLVIGIGGVVVVAILLVVLGVLPGLKPGVKPTLKATLEFWGVEDDFAAYQKAKEEFAKRYPGITINYKKFEPENYEKAILDARISGRGPDIFMIDNSWLPKHFNKLFPLPAQKMNLETLKQLFPQAVEQDFAPDGAIFALPLSIDTLALFYNKNIFDQNAVVLPPQNWLEFQNLISRLGKMDVSGKIAKAAAGIGGSAKTVENSADILYLLMLQSGVQMTDKEFTRAEFNSSKGQEVLNFYLQFANPSSFYYTWNDDMKKSFDSFAAEETAMVFAYSSQKPLIEAKNPFLKMGTSPMLQPAQAEKMVNYPDYWGYAVSNRTAYPQEAWDFVLTLTTDFDSAQSYLDLTAKPPALRFLINKYLEDWKLGLFAKQALTARSWPQPDAEETDKVFSTMIADILAGKLASNEALKQAAEQVTRLMIK